MTRLNSQGGGSGSSGMTELTGDVTAGPGSGSQAATIANDAVTYAKMQDVSAASRLLGRGSASGSGNVEEITLGTGLSMSGTTINSTGGVGGSGLVLVEQHTASSSASLNFTSCFTSAYDDYLIRITGLVPATNSAIPYLRVSTNGGSSYDSGANYDWSNTTIAVGTATSGANGAANASAFKLFTDSGSANGVSSSYPMDLDLSIRNPLGSTYRKNLQGIGNAVYAVGPSSYGFGFYAIYTPTTAVNAFQILYSTGNIASGIVRVYGLTK